MTHAPLVYIETSVFGFFADELPHNCIHSGAVRTSFSQMEAGVLDGITSRVTIEELSDAPAALRPGLMELASTVRLCDVDDAEAARLTALHRGTRDSGTIRKRCSARRLCDSGPSRRTRLPESSAPR